MSRIKCCKDCTKRHVGCHSECQDYITEKRMLEEELQRVAKQRDLDYLLDSHFSETAYKCSKFSKYKK